MSMQSRVFVVQEVFRRMDLTPARQYGELVYLFPSSVNHPSDEEAARMESQYLTDFDPQKDYVLLVGSPTAMAQTVACLARRFQNFWCLEYQRESHSYNPKIL